MLRSRFVALKASSSPMRRSRLHKTEMFLIKAARPVRHHSFFPSLFFDPGSFQKLQFGMSKLGLIVHGLEHCETLENDACMITCRNE